MDDIVDLVLRKLSDCILQRKPLSKRDFDSVSDSAIPSLKSAEERKQQAAEFWDKVVAMNIPHMTEAVRWDIFEENFVVYLLENANFSSNVLDRI